MSGRERGGVRASEGEEAIVHAYGREGKCASVREQECYSTDFATIAVCSAL